jgi:DNA (cytosine-5)-methyltransferase 1
MKKFKVVMEAMTKLPNYYVNVFCPVDASNWLPQRRKRLILIGTKRPYSIIAPTQQNNRPSLKSLLEENPEVEMPDYVLRRINGNYRDLPIIIDPRTTCCNGPNLRCSLFKGFKYATCKG